MNKLTIILTTACIAFITIHTQAQEITGIEKTNFGGSGYDYFNAVTAVSDGFIAVGHSASFGTGDWTGVTGKGSIDAIVVKYNNAGNIVWKKNFGGSDAEYFSAVTAVSNGFIAVGDSYPASFGNGDWADVTGKGNRDAIAVKYDNAGNIVWKKNFGGSGEDYFTAVAAVSDGFIAVGYSYPASFGNGDWTGVTGKGGRDAIAVKYDNNGNIVWKKNVGGSDYDYFNAVTTVSDGIIVVGNSRAASFGTGDWTGFTGKGESDAIAVKYDNNGNIVWKKNVGGSDYDYFQAVTAVSDGIIVVGYSRAASFGTGDWAGVTGKEGDDAIAVKYDNAGNIVWKKNFGGKDDDHFLSVTAVSNGIIAVGYSAAASFGNGDWAGVTGKGGRDAIAVKYDNNGNIVWKKNVGGSDYDYFNAVTTVSGDIVAVGYSWGDSFGTGDWTGVTGKGSDDATVVKFITYKTVTDIIDIPTTATLNTMLQLTGTVVPSNAANKTINWSMISAGTTNAVISGNDFFASSEGVAFIKATIIDGIATGTDYVKNFSITVSKDVSIAEIAASKINIYPNPTTGQLIINNEQGTIENVEVCDISGRTVETWHAASLQQQTVLDISHLSSGIYFIKVKTEEGEVVRKVMKE